LKYLLDTNVISELVARIPNPQVINWIDALDTDSVYLSVVTIGEIRKGIEKLPDSTRKISLENWLSNDLLVRFTGHILVLDIAAMLNWGELIGRLERLGRPLPAIDSLIAALAIHHGCTLVTRNEEDFKDTGVVVINPWK
jgi:predicted nucleic acid-binding protein